MGTIKRILGANAISQACGMALQLAVVPIYLYFWSSVQYGIWLTYAALPSYLALSDLGIFMAVTNELIAEREKGGSVVPQVFAILVAFSFSLIVLVCGIGGILCIFLLDVAGSEIIYSLSCYTLFSVLIALPSAALKAEKLEDRAIYIQSFSRLMEVSIISAVLWMSGTMEALAAALAVYRLVILLSAVIYVRKNFPLYRLKFKFEDIVLAIGRLRISLLSQGLPLAHATNAQGVLLVVSSYLGPSAAASFNVCRQASRIVAQIGCIIPNSYWTTFTRSFAKGDFIAFSQQYKSAKKFTVASAGGVALIFAMTGPVLLEIWSSGQINLSYLSAATLALSGFIYCLSNVTVVALLARNSFTLPASAALASSLLGVLTVLVVCALQFGLDNSSLYFGILFSELIQLYMLSRWSTSFLNR